MAPQFTNLFARQILVVRSLIALLSSLLASLDVLHSILASLCSFELAPTLLLVPLISALLKDASAAILDSSRTLFLLLLALSLFGLCNLIPLLLNLVRLLTTDGLLAGLATNTTQLLVSFDQV